MAAPCDKSVACSLPAGHPGFCSRAAVLAAVDQPGRVVHANSSIFLAEFGGKEVKLRKAGNKQYRLSFTVDGCTRFLACCLWEAIGFCCFCCSR